MAVSKAARNLHLTVAMVLALGVMVFANLLADRGFARVDLTADRKYSLSEPFRSIMNRLDKPMKVTYCVSKSVPDWFESDKRDILDRLREIEMASNGKIILDVVDPADNNVLKEELEKQDLNFTVGTREKGKLTYMVINTSLRLTYAEKPSEWVPVIRRSEDLEYELANKIYALTQKEKPVVAILRPKPEQPPMMMGRQPPDPFGWMLRDPDTTQKIEVKDIDLTENNSIPEKAKLLILVRPAALSERACYEVSRYLAGGGRVLLLASPFKVSPEGFGDGYRVQKTPTGLEDYLKDLGVTFDPDFVCDDKNVRLAQLNMLTGKVKQIALPYFVKIENIDQESPITRLLPGLVMPFPAALSVEEAKAKSAGLNATVLARTSNLSWKEAYSDTFKTCDESKAGKNPNLPVFVQLEGTFPFPWEGKDVPAWSGAAAKDESAEKKDDAKTDEAKKEGPAKASVVRKPDARPILFIWACPESFDSTYLGNQQVGEEFRGNINVMPNIVESCSLGEELIQLRSKQFATRSIHSLDEKGDKTKFLIKLFLLGGTALVLISGGLVYWFVRRAGQVRYERQMSKTGPSSFMP